MSYVYALLGFVALIILHEAGHFTAAKAVGMRVERFALFFPPLLFKVRRGETEYGIGALPFGGYVKITGMSPNEEIPPEVLPRAYYNQPVWKRIVVIAAGPAVNIVIAIILVWAILATSGEINATVNTRVVQVTKGGPAAQVLRPGDRILSADGVSGSEAKIREVIQSHRCAGGATTEGCTAATPARLVVRRRNGTIAHVAIRPRYTSVTSDGQTVSGMLIGISFGVTDHTVHPGVLTAGRDSITKLWSISKQTVSAVARVFEPKERKQLSGVVGTYTVTKNSFKEGTVDALDVLALISLSLGVINLFPFLPLDGGHIFWAVAEKLRGKRIPFTVMERAGVVGFVLILALFVIGLSNDISGLSHGTFNVH
jgi:regulator of sigma E protease